MLKRGGSDMYWVFQGYKLLESDVIEITAEYNNEDKKASISMVYKYACTETQDFSQWFVLRKIKVEIKTKEGEAKLETDFPLNVERLLAVYGIHAPLILPSFNTKLDARILEKGFIC